MATYQELRARSQQVRDEQNIGGNTALRVGQLLMDIVKYFNDNDAAASEYLQQHFAMVNDGTQLLNWQQSPIVILHTMGETYDEGDFRSLSQGENYYRNGFIVEANGQGGGINGETPKVNVLYVNLANDTLYTWNGASFDAITTGGGGGSISGDDILKNAYYLNGNLVLVFETENGDKTVSIPVNFDASNYVPTSRTVNGKALSQNITISQSDIPGLVAALAAKVSGIKTSDNTLLTPDSNGVVTLPPAGSTISPATANPSMDGTANVGSSAKYAREDHVHPHDSTKLSKSDVSVETQGDGTVDINVKDDIYTINLNHTHEGMAKLVKCTEATLPQTMADDTIYVQVDDLTTPTEIEALHIFGLEFTGGGVPAGTPAITKPSGTSINLGENSGSGVSKAIEIRANSHITGDLTVGLAANSDLSFDTTNLPSGVTYNSGAGTLTIAQATAIQGVNITIVYSGSGEAEIDGGIVISGGGATPKSVAVVVEVPQPIGVKLTGTQWLQTDYYPNPDTEFTMKVKFDGNVNTSGGAYFLTCANNTSSDGEKFQLYLMNTMYSMAFVNLTSIYLDGDQSNVQKVDFDSERSNFVLGNSIISYSKGTTKGTIAFIPGGNDSLKKTHSTSLKLTSMQNPVRIGRGNSAYFSAWQLIIYELTFTENGNVVRHYVPWVQNGVPGLYDTVNKTFISSETETQVVPVYNS